MKPTLKNLLFAFCAITTAAVAQTPSTTPISPYRAGQIGNYENYVRTLTPEIDRYKLEVERLKTRQLQYRAAGDERSAKGMDLQVKQAQATVTMKQQELQMYTKGITDLKAPRSDNPSIAAVQDQIVQINMEKARLTISQTAATQGGRTAEAQQIAAQIAQKTAQVAAKQQEIKLLTLQAK